MHPDGNCDLLKRAILREDEQAVMRVVSQTARAESVTGWVEAWRVNQVPVGLEAYEKSSWEEVNPEIAVVPVTVTPSRAMNSVSVRFMASDHLFTSTIFLTPR